MYLNQIWVAVLNPVTWVCVNALNVTCNKGPQADCDVVVKDMHTKRLATTAAKSANCFNLNTEI